jgi:hypothetical protein
LAAELRQHRERNALHIDDRSHTFARHVARRLATYCGRRVCPAQAQHRRERQRSHGRWIGPTPRGLKRFALRLAARKRAEAGRLPWPCGGRKRGDQGSTHLHDLTRCGDGIGVPALRPAQRRRRSGALDFPRLASGLPTLTAALGPPQRFVAPNLRTGCFRGAPGVCVARLDYCWLVYWSSWTSGFLVGGSPGTPSAVV